MKDGQGSRKLTSGIRFLSMDDFDLENKTIFVRVDINIPLDPSTLQILDDTRIRAIGPTLADLRSSKVVIGSHQSRPGRIDFTSLEPHARRLQRYCSQKVKYSDDIFGPHARQAIKQVQSGEILVLDNLRFCAEENMDCTPEMAAKTHMVKRLAPLFDLFVNDAFGTAHRSQPSLIGFAEVLPTVAGRLMERELSALNRVLVKTERPSVFVLGGAKVEDKLPVIEHVFKNGKADKVLLGGIPAKTFLMAKGLKLGQKNEQEMKGLEEYVEKAKNVLRDFPDRVEVPSDFAILKNEKRQEIMTEELPTGEIIMDIGRKTTDRFLEEIGKARTVVASGPLGIFEKSWFDHGTRNVLEAISDCDGYTVIGGGHLTGLASMMGIEEKVSHLSTAGGAMLSLLAGERLPVVDALERAAERYRSGRMSQQQNTA
ncbi:phosphoglycerate kinase [Candidatus Bathyarchaeota archaeon]|nr:phosphoglycerate kinase [Candidatus Bathyarchaeota archaeon]